MEIEVVVTHHEVADQLVVCTADFPIVETNIPLGSNFEPGNEYTIRVNSDVTVSFEAPVGGWTFSKILYKSRRSD